MTDLRLGSMVMEDSGNGPELVMIHGLGGTSNSFQTVMGALGQYRVLRPDLPGAGRSASRPGYSGMEGMIAALKNALNAAGVENAHFVGHSMGTLICQHLAANIPAMVRSLTLFGPMLEPPDAARVVLIDRADKARSEGMADIADTISRNSISEVSHSKSPVISAIVRESILRQNPEDYASHCEALSEAQAANHSEIKCPTLLVVGEADPITPVEMTRKLSERIKNTREEILEGIGHWPLVEDSKNSEKLLCTHLNQVK